MTHTADAYVEVDTPAGRVRGRWRTDPGSGARSAAFLGIPFAEAPVGERRFGAPVPQEPWSGVRDALEHGATAQRGDTGITLIPEPSVEGESTLNVDVFTPAPGEHEARLPVLVWIHGGGYVSGSPASPWYDGRAFNRDGIVTVSLSYRVGFDGFGAIPGAPANRGVLDWIAGLEWVRRSIACFGGDPDRVTIAGQSAGGGAVLTLLGLPATQQLFRGAYAISPAVADVDPARAERFAARVWRRLGIPANRESLAQMPERQVLDAQQGALDEGGPARLQEALHHGVRLGPTVDGTVLARPTIEALRSGIGADKPLVLGSTDDEFAMTLTRFSGILRCLPRRLVLRLLGLRGGRASAYLDANPQVVAQGTAAVAGQLVSDLAFRAGVLRAAIARQHAPTWMYRTAFRSTAFGLALHCVDVPFWFDCLDAEHVEALTGPNPPQALATEMHAAVVRFVRDGDPGWSPWTPDEQAERVYDAAGASPTAHGYAGVMPLL